MGDKIDLVVKVGSTNVLHFICKIGMLFILPGYQKHSFVTNFKTISGYQKTFRKLPVKKLKRL